MKVIPLLLLLSLAAPAHTAPEPLIPTPPLALLETLEEKAHCKRAGEEINLWVKRLRLENWKITLVCGVPDHPYFKEQGYTFIHGASQFDNTSLSGVVWVNPKSTKPPKLIVIHELLHFVVAEVREARSNLIEERAVWTLAELLHNESN